MSGAIRDVDLVKRSAIDILKELQTVSAQTKISIDKLKNATIQLSKVKGTDKEARALTKVNKLTAIYAANKSKVNILTKQSVALESQLNTQRSIGTAVIKKQTSAYSVFRGVMTKVAAAMTAFYLAMRGVNALKNTLIRLDSFKFALEKITGSAFQAQESMEFLIKTAKDFGISLDVAADRYTKFFTAAKQSGLAVEETRSIFANMSKAAGVLGLKAEEVEGVFLALEQMLSKGKVTTEELRRQLGERLPGAFGVMAQTVNKLNPNIEVTVQTLDEMLKKGQVLSAETLPEFAKEYNRAFGIDKVTKVDTLAAAQARFNNAWTELVFRVESGNGSLTKAFKSVINFGTAAIDALTPTKNITNAIEDERQALNSLVSQISLTNEKSNERVILIDKLKRDYPAFIRLIDDENISNESLQTGLTKINDLYLKRIILTKLAGEAEKAQIKFANATAESLRDQDEAMQFASRLNKIFYKDQLDLVGLTQEQVFKLIKDRLLAEQVLYAKQNNDLKENDKIRLSNIKVALNEIEEAKRVLTSSRTNVLFTGTDLDKEKAKLNRLEELYNLTLDQLNDLFTRPEDEDGVIIRMTKLSDEELKKIRDNALKDRLQYEKLLLEGTRIRLEQQLKLEDNSFDDLVKLENKLYELRKEIAEKTRDISLVGKDTTSEKKVIQEAHNNDMIKLAIDHEDKLNDIVSSNAGALEAKLNLRLTIIKTAYDNEEAVLNNRYKSGEIKEEQYQKELIALQDRYKKEYLNATINSLEFILKNETISVDDRIELLEKLAEARKELSEGSDDEEKIKWDKIVEYATEVVAAVFDIFNALHENQLENIQAEMEATEEKYDRLYELAEGDSEHQKAVLRDKEFAMKKLEKEELKIKQKQAKLNKAQSLAQIAMKTAEGIIGAWAEVPKFDWGISAGLISAMIGTLGAAQAAAVLATPIPKYAEGTDYHKGGLAYVGDGGRSEIIETSKGTFKTPNTATLAYLEKGARVHKSEDVYKDIVAKSIMSNVKDYGDSKQIKEAIDEGFKRVKVNNKIYQKINLHVDNWSYNNTQYS